MKAVMLLGTLKASGLSHTETLCEFLAARMARQGVHSEVVKLVDHAILPGTFSDMGEGDEWPEILDKIMGAEILVFATPIWWSNASSLTQRAVERLDELHDRLLEGQPSGLENKVGGIVITGDSDGAQQIIGTLANFLNAVGIVLPPYATLSVLWERQAKSADPTKAELLRKYESDYTETADRMTRQLLAYANRPAG